jgi:ABC-2 type transport system permease protein
MKEFTVRYKQAVFGFLWIILNPLLQMIIMGAIFSNFVKVPNYFVFLFSGLLPWQFFSLTLSKVTPCFVNERSLLQKAVFGREIIPLSIIFSNALNLTLSLVLFIITLLFLIPPAHFNLLLLIVSVIWLVVFTVGISLFTSSLNVRFRDVSFFVQTVTLLWFYATPILYSLNQLPSKLQLWLSFNPVVAPIALFQSSLLGQTLPSLELIFTNAVIGMLIFFIGIITFVKESPYFVDWL